MKCVKHMLLCDIGVCIQVQNGSSHGFLFSPMGLYRCTTLYYRTVRLISVES